MAIELTTKYLPYVDELFTTESKSALLTNKDFSFDGAHTVKIRKVSTSEMTDYGRSGPAEGNWSRFGAPSSLNATPETFTLRKDRAFTFIIDKLDENETDGALAPASALARQLREVVVPEVDAYTLSMIAAGAGTVAFKALSAVNIYDEIVAANKVLDDYEAPETRRVLVVTPATLLLMKKNSMVVMATETGAAAVQSGVIGTLDGMRVLKVPANRLPAGFGFMIVHPCANVGVEKLTDYRVHADPPGISGSLVEGRIVYDCFTLDAKKKAVYVHMAATYTAVENPSGNPKSLGYYEKSGDGYDAYSLTADTTVTEGKTYYTATV